MKSSVNIDGLPNGFIRPSQPLEPEETRAWVDARTDVLAEGVEAMLRAIQELNSFRNSVSPIYRLPDELLVEILWELSKGMPTHTDIVSASHVCRRWRHVALAHAKLWSTVELSNWPQFDMFLRRSKEALLHVYYQSDDYSAPSAVTEMLLSHIHRSELIFIFHEHHSTMESVLNSFEFIDAPHLKDISLRYDAASDETKLSVNGPVIFNDNLPNLRSLALSGVSIPWSSSIYKNLTTLKVFNMFGDVNQRTTLQRFLDTLEQCPALEMLHLLRSGPLLTATNPPDRRVHLPHLKKFDIYLEHTAHVVALLSHLSLPAETIVFLDVDSLHTDTMYPLPRDLSALLPFAQLRMVEFHIPKDDPQVIVRGRPGTEGDEAFKEPRLAIQMWRAHQASALYTLHTVLDLSFVEVFIISTTVAVEGALWTHRDWVQAVAPLRNMHTLRVVSGDQILLCRLLLALLELDENGAGFCPSLESVEIKGAEISDLVLSALELFIRVRAPWGLKLVDRELNLS